MSVSSPEFWLPAWSEPGDVVEAALDISALGEGLALVSEDRPDLLLVVERYDEAGTDGLKRGVFALRLEQGDTVGFPAAADIAAWARGGVERGDERLDLRLHGGVRSGLLVIGLHRDRVEAVGDLVV